MHKRFFLKTIRITFFLFCSLLSAGAITVDEYWKNINIHTGKKEWTEAETLLLKAVREYPGEEYFYSTLSWVYREQKKIREAILIIDKAVKLFPGSKNILENKKWNHINAGWEFIENKQLEKAYVEAIEAVKIDPKDQWVLLLHGNVLIRQKKYDEALEHLIKGAGQYPDQPQFQNAIGWAYVEKSNMAKEKNDLQQYADFALKAFEISGETDYIINHYASSLVVLKDYPKAIRLFLNGIKKYPEYPHFHTNLAWAYADYSNDFREKGDMKEYDRYAALCYEKAPDTDWAINHYGVSRIYLKEYEKAVRILKEGMKKFPAYEWFRPNLRWCFYEFASQYTNQSDYSNAVRQYQEIQSLYPNEINALANIGWTLRDWNRIETKTADIRKFLNDSEKLFRSGISGDDLYSLLEPVGQLIQITKNTALFNRFYPDLVKMYPDDHRIQQWIGSVMSYLNNVSGKSDNKVRDLALSFVKKAMILYEKNNPDRPILQNIGLPLKGRFQVLSQFDDPEAVTHNGYLKYCYDFGHVGAYGEPVKPQTDGRENTDYYTFGQTVYAAADGVVEYVNDNQPDRPVNSPGYYGNDLSIRSTDGYLFQYVHLKNGSIRVRKGDPVKKGDPIGEIGNSGYSFAPHLHFGIIDQNGISVNFRLEVQSVIRSGKSEKSDGTLLRLDIVENP